MQTLSSPGRVAALEALNPTVLLRNVLAVVFWSFQWISGVHIGPADNSSIQGVELLPATNGEAKSPFEVLDSQELALAVKPVTTVLNRAWVIKLN
jgi:hypothetical protein